jgi:hypothetical protein
MVKKKDLDVDFGFDLDDVSVNAQKKPTTKKKIEPTVKNNIDKNKEEAEITRRLTLDIPISLHKKFKMLAMEQNTTMTKILRTWIKENT